MAKRRTRKQKEKAKHTFTVTWKPEAKKDNFEADVNRQFKKNKKTEELNNLRIKHSDFSENTINLALIKKDILKSLILAGFILASEVVLYFIL